MVLQYITPLEGNLESVINKSTTGPILIISSSAIPVLYGLATSDENFVAVDFNKEQFMLIYFLLAGIRNLDREGFMNLVVGKDLGTTIQNGIEDDILEESGISNRSHVRKLIKEYQERVAKISPQIMGRWYHWLDDTAYDRLKTINTDRLRILFGEFTKAVQSEPSNYFGYIDLSNIREWKFVVSELHLRTVTEHDLVLMLSSFKEWDKELADLCADKSRQGCILREKTFPDFWPGYPLRIEESSYWRKSFRRRNSSEYEIPIDNRKNKLIVTYYERLKKIKV